MHRISSNEFIVNSTEFNNIPNEANLYEISMNDDNYVYLLGHLDYKQNLVPIIQPRAPFETSYYGIASNFASETISYYQSINQ